MLAAQAVRARRSSAQFILAAVLLMLGAAAKADRIAAQGDSEEFEHRLVLGVGGAFEVEVLSGEVHGGGNFMLEVTAIENWLELELGVSLLAAEGGLELPIDLLAKRPFRLSRRIEMMIGLGPEMT